MKTLCLRAQKRIKNIILDQQSMRKLTVTVGLSLSVQAVALFCHLFILDEKKKIILTLFHPLVFINASVETPVTVQECFFVAYSFLTTFLINCTSMITFFIVSIKMWENHHRNKIECSGFIVSSFFYALDERCWFFLISHIIIEKWFLIRNLKESKRKFQIKANRRLKVF